MLSGTTLATGLGGAIGSQYLLASHRLVFVEFGGNLSALDLITSTHTVLGSGYSSPEDVVVAADGDTAYVSERSGDIVRVSLSGGAGRGAATVIASGLTAPHQMALDEAHGALYVVEFTDPGRLLRIDLASNTVTVAFSPLHQAIGLLVAADGRFAYVTEQTAAGTGTLSRIDLVVSARQQLYASATAPLFMMTWSDLGQNAIVVTERDPANTVWSIDLNTAPPAAHAVLTGTPARPSSAAVPTPDRILVCCDNQIDEYLLTGSVYTPGGPLLLGIGFVPEDRIDGDGLANTSGDPSYFFQVADCPFGGSLPLMVNHPRAVGLGAAFYKVLVDGALQRTPFSDYRWDAAASEFQITSVGPDANGFYTLHQTGEVWFNPFLGCFVDTGGLSDDAQHTVSVEIFSAASDGTVIDTSSETTSVSPRIVNAGPIATINGIFHPDLANPVRVCEIVSGGSYDFSFSVTAYHPSQWLRSWGLAAYWGDNRSGSVGGGSYSGTPSKRWNDPSTPLLAGPPAAGDPLVPAGGWSCVVAGDRTSYQCAHTFWLSVYDRVINGWNFIHSNAYHQSITINLPDPPP